MKWIAFGVFIVKEIQYVYSILSKGYGSIKRQEVLYIIRKFYQGVESFKISC